MMTDTKLLAYNRTRTVHRAFCKALDKVPGKALQALADIAAATSCGFAPCKMCKPAERLIASAQSQNLHMASCSRARGLRKNIREFRSFTAALDAGYSVCRWCRTPGMNALLNARPPVRASIEPLVRSYERIAWIELTLSYAIKRVLVDAHGEAAWWKEGIPQKVRQDCRQRQEEGDADASDDPFLYVTFIDYKEIIDKRWPLFEPMLPADLAANKQLLVKGLGKLNALRNRIMHPTKSYDLDKLESNEAWSLGECLDWGRWRFVEVP